MCACNTFIPSVKTCRCSLMIVRSAEGDGEGEGGGECKGVREGETEDLECSTMLSGGGADTCLPLGALGVLNSSSFPSALEKEDLLDKLGSKLVISANNSDWLRLRLPLLTESIQQPLKEIKIAALQLGKVPSYGSGNYRWTLAR